MSALQVEVEASMEFSNSRSSSVVNLVESILSCLHFHKTQPQGFFLPNLTIAHFGVISASPQHSTPICRVLSAYHRVLFHYIKFGLVPSAMPLLFLLGRSHNFNPKSSASSSFLTIGLSPGSRKRYSPMIVSMSVVPVTWKISVLPLYHFDSCSVEYVNAGRMLAAHEDDDLFDANLRRHSSSYSDPRWF
jgi:hypothetical protein